MKLLSERLLAFRDSEGRYGLIDEFCAHRGVSLWFGRNEECGLRCSYHGWKYDVTGQCVDVPSEPVESGFCQKIKLKSYPLVKRGRCCGPIWDRPTNSRRCRNGNSPRFPPEQSFISKRLQECNWLQAMEGGIDSSHVSFLHRGDLGSDPLFKGAKGNSTTCPTCSRYFEVVEQPGGLYIGARRNAENGNYYWRITPWVMPCFTMIPPRGDHPIHGHFWIPIDDENCWAWSYDFHPTRALTERERDAMRDGAGRALQVPARHLSAARQQGQRLSDGPRRAEGRQTFSGVDGFAMQDASLQESMGPICDRTKENLVSTDNGIIMARHRLMRAAKALVEKGITPPGVDPAHHRVRSASVVLPPDQAFKDAAKEALTSRPGVAQTTV